MASQRCTAYAPGCREAGVEVDSITLYSDYTTLDLVYLKLKFHSITHYLWLYASECG